jgi:hypothetical protein
MLKIQVSPLPEKQNAAVHQLMAVEQLLVPVARLWCRSFGITDEKAIGRLTERLLEKIQDELAAGARLDLIQSNFDDLAAGIIRGWFVYVLGREISEDGKSLAILRLAFLDVNYDGRWSPLFLSREICVQELSSELEAMMIEPTPASSPRVMLRQAF